MHKATCAICTRVISSLSDAPLHIMINLFSLLPLGNKNIPIRIRNYDLFDPVTAHRLIYLLSILSLKSSAYICA